MEYFTGIDLHKTHLLVTTQDAAGNVVKQRRLRNDQQVISEYFATIEGTHHAVVEAGLGWYWLRDLLQSQKIEMILAHPLRVRAIASAKVKTDAVDSATLAMLLRTGLIPEAHMISPQRRALRDLTRRRRRLVDERTRMVNARHGVLQAVNRTCVEELEPADRVNHASLSTIIELLERQITEIESTLARELREDWQYLLVQTIPGIGPIHAAEIVLETDGIERFASEKKYFSYARVVPGCDNSGQRVRSKTSKQGNAHLRRVFGDAAVHAIALYPEFGRHFERLCRRHPEAQARTLVSKEIARGVYHVLKNKEPYMGLKGKALEQRKASEPGVLRKLRVVLSEHSPSAPETMAPETMGPETMAPETMAPETMA